MKFLRTMARAILLTMIIYLMVIFVVPDVDWWLIVVIAAVSTLALHEDE